VNQALHLSGVTEFGTGLVRLGENNGNVTAAGWHVTPVFIPGGGFPRDDDKNINALDMATSDSQFVLLKLKVIGQG